MKTIADIKRKMIVGTKWHALWKCRNVENDMGIRLLGKVNTVSFGFNSTRHPGEYSWCDWPKKEEVTFLSENSFKIKQGDIELIYTKVE